jgi:hypothetical protein
MALRLCFNAVWVPTDHSNSEIPFVDNDRRPTFEEPAKYRIRVRGSLPAGWCERIGGMRISKFRSPDGNLQTELTGLLEDQAALVGILNMLYELHMPLLSVEWEHFGQ